MRWLSPPSAEPVRFPVCLGAGNGAVTAQLAPLAREVIATETSGPMAARLRQRGLPCLLAELPAAGYTHDLVSCLNVLDRTARPLALRWVDTSRPSRGLRSVLLYGLRVPASCVLCVPVAQGI